MRKLQRLLTILLALLMAAPPPGFSASHREAPITALDRTADITDLYAFVSFNNPSRVTFLLNVDPLLEPSNGPNYFPFDPDVLYAIRIDNNYDAVADIVFEFQFQTEIRAPQVPVGFIGAGSGINAPANAPPGGPAQVVPPAITSLDGPGSAGLNLRQTYTVTMLQGSGETPTRTTLSPAAETQRLFAVPSNAGPRTMPNYSALAQQGVYDIGMGARVFAGTVDDPFFIDLGAAFDSFNFRAPAFGGAPGTLSAFEDQQSSTNFAPDDVSGFNVNTIALEVPASLITTGGRPAIGVWGATYRRQTSVRSTNLAEAATTGSGAWIQVQRMGNPLINELLIGTGMKDRWSRGEPASEGATFASSYLDPVLARVLNAVFNIPVPSAPRTDLLPLVTYTPLITGDASIPAGPVADLLRLNTSIPATAAGSRSRLGALGGDTAGFPNGRRPSDDVTDIALRVVAGALAGSGFSRRLGDGVNMNDMPFQETFPFVAFAQSGRNSRHVDPGGRGCRELQGPFGFSPGQGQGGGPGTGGLFDPLPCPVE